MEDTKQPITTLVAIPISEPEFVKEHSGFLNYKKRAIIGVKIGNISTQISCYTEKEWDSDTQEYKHTHSTNVDQVRELRALIDVGIEIDFARVLAMYAKGLQKEEAAEEALRKKQEDEWWAGQWIHAAHTLVKADIKKRGLAVTVTKPERPNYRVETSLRMEYKKMEANLVIKEREYGGSDKYQFSHAASDFKKRTFSSPDSAVRMFVTLVDKHLVFLEKQKKEKMLLEAKREDVRERLERMFGFPVKAEESEEWESGHRRGSGSYVKRFKYFTVIERNDWSHYNEVNRKKYKSIIHVHKNSLGIESYTFLGLQGLTATQVKNLHKALVE